MLGFAVALIPILLGSVRSTHSCSVAFRDVLFCVSEIFSAAAGRNRGRLTIRLHVIDLGHAIDHPLAAPHFDDRAVALKQQFASDLAGVIVGSGFPGLS